MMLGIGLAGAIFTSILARSGSTTAGSGLFNAVHYGFLGAAVAAALGIIVSLSGRSVPGRGPEDFGRLEV
jgi:hypothetical protein